MIETPFGIRSEIRYRPSKPVRDPEYRAYVRRFACAGCGRTWRVEAAHTGPHGTSQKASDLTCIPLCAFKCHPAFDADPRGFAEEHQMDVPALIQSLNQGYAERVKGKVA